MRFPNEPDEAMSKIERLLDIMARLRAPETGCPWDREQDFASIAPYTIEEAYEVADAIARDDMAALKDELGDLLFQVVFHAQMAKERDAFDFEEIAETISEKMLRRHPHVFGDIEIPSADAQTRAWEAHKADERAARARAEGRRALSRLDGVAAGLPALVRAFKIQRRAARAGFDWKSLAPVLDKLDEERAELDDALQEDADSARIAEEMGDLLFACVNLARWLELEPESTLREATAKFERRFRALEKAFAAEGRALEQASLDELEEAWQTAKAREG